MPEVTAARALLSESYPAASSTLLSYWPSSKGASSDAADVMVHGSHSRAAALMIGPAEAQIIRCAEGRSPMVVFILDALTTSRVAWRWPGVHAEMVKLSTSAGVLDLFLRTALMAQFTSSAEGSPTLEVNFREWGKEWGGFFGRIADRNEPSALEEEFSALVAQWRESCGPTSSLTKIFLDPAYQRIIGMGKAVVPLLIREMERRPDHWDWALRAITGADPTMAEDEGDLERIAARWVEWGKEQGYSE